MEISIISIKIYVFHNFNVVTYYAIYLYFDLSIFIYPPAFSEHSFLLYLHPQLYLNIFVLENQKSIPFSDF